MAIIQDCIVNLETLYSVSKKVSILGSAKRARVHRTMVLEKILEKILLHDHSILLLLSIIPNDIQELDISLIASAARNIMESTNIYFHIAQRGIDEDTVGFRISTMDINEIFNELNITEKFGFSKDCFHTQINRSYYQSSAERFQQFPQYMQLSTNERAQVVSGRKSTFQMKSPHILDEKTESAIYNLLSNSVHGLPLGLNSNSVNRTPLFTNFFHAERLLMISLLISRIYTAHVVKDYLNLRKHLYSLLNAEQKKHLKSYMSSSDLEDYIHMLRIEYEKPFV